MTWPGLEAGPLNPRHTATVITSVHLYWIKPALSPGFCSIEWIRVFQLPLDGMLVHHRVITPPPPPPTLHLFCHYTFISSPGLLFFWSAPKSRTLSMCTVLIFNCQPITDFLIRRQREKRAVGMTMRNFPIYLLCRSAWEDGMTESPHESESERLFSQTIQGGCKPKWWQKVNFQSYNKQNTNLTCSSTILFLSFLRTLTLLSKTYYERVFEWHKPIIMCSILCIWIIGSPV